MPAIYIKSLFYANNKGTLNKDIHTSHAMEKHSVALMNYYSFTVLHAWWLEWHTLNTKLLKDRMYTADFPCIRTLCVYNVN